jgi:hypothetical protein
MFKKLLLFFFLLCLQSAWSQVNPLPTNNSYRFITMTPSTIDESVTIEGSQYIDKTFYPSIFTCISEATPPIRYNTYKEEMEFMLDGKLYYLDKNENCELTINNVSYKYFKNYDSKDNDGYFVILTKSKDSKYILYKKEKVKFVPAYTPGSSYGEEKPAKYAVDKSKYYFKNLDKLVEFPEKKSELLKLFPNNKEAIELFLKENKIKFSDEASLLVLINFLNTL